MNDDIDEAFLHLVMLFIFLIRSVALNVVQSAFFLAFLLFSLRASGFGFLLTHELDIGIENQKKKQQFCRYISLMSTPNMMLSVSNSTVFFIIPRILLLFDGKKTRQNGS